MCMCVDYGTLIGGVDDVERFCEDTVRWEPRIDFDFASFAHIADM